MKQEIRNNLQKDFTIIALSIITAIALLKTGLLRDLLILTEDFWLLDSFVAGFFFTSVFTTAPAIVALGAIAQTSSSLFPMVAVGALGALCGDLIIFRFMKDRLGEDIIYVITHSNNKRFRAIFKLKFFRGFIFLLGALIIASPLPDELGLMMMGLSKTKVSLLIPSSLILNALGILIIALAARAL